MTREALLRKTFESISKLPDQKLKEVADFTDFLLSRIDDTLIAEGIQKITAEGKAFKFLEDDEEIYTVNDLKEVYK